MAATPFTAQMLAAILRRWTAVRTVPVGFFLRGAVLVPTIPDSGQAFWRFRCYRLFSHQLAERSLHGGASYGTMRALLVNICCDLCGRCGVLRGAAVCAAAPSPQPYTLSVAAVDRWLDPTDGMEDQHKLVANAHRVLSRARMGVFAYPLLDQAMRARRPGGIANPSSREKAFRFECKTRRIIQ